MRKSIYFACLLFGLAMLPYAAMANGFVNEAAAWLGNAASAVPADLLFAFARFAVTCLMLAAIHLVVGLLSGELNFLMALLSGIVPVYNGMARFIGNLTGSRMTLSDMFYADSVREVTVFGGFGNAAIALLALFVSWLAIRKLLRITDISSFSV